MALVIVMGSSQTINPDSVKAIFNSNPMIKIRTTEKQQRRRRRTITVGSSSVGGGNNWIGSECEKLVSEFDPSIPIEKASTPPSSWYTDSSLYDFELSRVFYRGWQAVGYTEQIKEPRDFFTGRLGKVEFVVCRDDGGKVEAFHNVCRHHASILVASGSGKKSCFVCPYHGWTYGLDGSLRKATRITGMHNFHLKEFGLISIDVAVWGPFVLLNLERNNNNNVKVANEWLGSTSEILKYGGVDSSLSYLFRRDYTIECNWKVFCDNYLDGGYHVPYAHKALASGLHLDSYSTTSFVQQTYEKVSIQTCQGVTSTQRLGSKALYAFIYPNFMINRYALLLLLLYYVALSVFPQTLMTSHSFEKCLYRMINLILSKALLIAKKCRLKTLSSVKVYKEAWNHPLIPPVDMCQSWRMQCTISTNCFIVIFVFDPRHSITMFLFLLVVITPVTSMFGFRHSLQQAKINHSPIIPT
ncbi:Choline monooxygenase, chloroplastic [Linum perenne]